MYYRKWCKRKGYRFSPAGAEKIYSAAQNAVSTFQSGTFDSKSRHVSKRGSPHLRRTLFQVNSIILQHSDSEHPVFRFMDKKWGEGKHYYVYMVAGTAKFLRIYYAQVKESLNTLKVKDPEAA